MCALLAKDAGGDFDQAPIGNHIAICYQVIDLGFQEEVYQDQVKSVHKIFLAWELCSELMENGNPFSVNNFYTLSLSNKSNLRPMLESWRGKAFTESELEGFDLKNILGAPCMLNVIHKPRKKDNALRAVIGSVSPLVKGMTKPVMANEPLFYSIDDDVNGLVFNRLPEWLQKKINRTPAVVETARVDERNPPIADFIDDDLDSLPF